MWEGYLMTSDADSNRMSFTSSTGGTWEYVYDITAGIPAVIKETGLKTYVREPDGSLIAMFVESYPYYYHFDALGSTRMLTDESGHITDSYTYDAWGNGLTHYPNSISQPYQYVGQLGYYTHYQDANLPLLQLGVRFYDLEVGRFGQRDSIRRDLETLYLYAGGSPMSLVDPSGRVVAPPKPKNPVKPTPKPEIPLKPLPPKPIEPVKPVKPVSPWPGLCSKCLCTLGIAACLFFASEGTAGPTPEELREECNNIYVDCYERSRSKFQEMECYYCQMQCINNANNGCELPWPNTDRCRYQDWPQGRAN